MMVQRKCIKIENGARGMTAVRNVCYSSRGPEFGSQHQCWAVYNQL